MVSKRMIISSKCQNISGRTGKTLLVILISKMKMETCFANAAKIQT